MTLTRGPSIGSFLGSVPAEGGFYDRNLGHPAHNDSIHRNQCTAENDGDEAVDDAVVGLGPCPDTECACDHGEASIAEIDAPVMEHPQERQQVHKGLQGREGGCI